MIIFCFFKKIIFISPYIFSKGFLNMKGRTIIWIIIIAAVCVAFYAYDAISNRKPYDETKFAAGNGRLEATEINVASKLAGRLESLPIEEGQMVQKGDILAKIQTNVLEADLAQANANIVKAEAAKKSAQATVEVKKSDIEAQKANLNRAQTEMEANEKTYERNKQLVGTGSVSQQTFENTERLYLTSKASVETEKAVLKQKEASLLSAQADLAGADANINAAKASAARIQADIDDSALRSPVEGRVQYKIAEVGEVVSAGGAVVNVIDLNDVYITFFLPEIISGKVAIGADVRIVLDAQPDYPIPANISYVATSAQFTPKTVETESERQKMMFRVKAAVDERLLQKYIEFVKTGLPGVAYVKLDPNAEWPDFLKLKKETEDATK